MTTTAEPGTERAENQLQLVDLEQLVAGVRWRRKLWVRLALVGCVLGALSMAVQPPKPTATVEILMTFSAELPPSSTPVTTEIALLHTTRVASAALARLRLDEAPEKFVKTYEGASISPNLIELTVVGPTTEEAIRRADALAATYIADYVGRNQALADGKAKALLDNRDKLLREAATAPQDRAASLTSQAASLKRQADEARIGRPEVASGTLVVDGPRKATKGFKSTLALRLGGGFLIGLLTGLGLAAIASVTQERPVLRRDIATHLGASVIAQLPAPRRRPMRWLARLPGLSRLARPAAQTERRRVAATLARVLAPGTEVASLLELGCPGVAADLARDVADELAVGCPVVLVDDLPDRELHAPGPGRKRTPAAAVPEPESATGPTGENDAPPAPTAEPTDTGPDTGSTADTGPTAEPTDTEVVTTDTEAVATEPEPDAEPTEARPRFPVTVVDGAEYPFPAVGADRHLAVGSVRPGAPWTDLQRLGRETVLVVQAGYADTNWLHTVSRQLADAHIEVIGVALVHPDPRDATDGTLWDELHAVRGRAVARAAARADRPPLTVSSNGHGPGSTHTLEVR